MNDFALNSNPTRTFRGGVTTERKFEVLGQPQKTYTMEEMLYQPVEEVIVAEEVEVKADEPAVEEVVTEEIVAEETPAEVVAGEVIAEEVVTETPAVVETVIEPIAEEVVAEAPAVSVEVAPVVDAVS